MALSKSDVLSGPIVRSVTPNEVVIWVALKASAKIELSVYKGMITLDAAGAITETAISSVVQDTIQFGKLLHIAAVRLALADDKLLQWGQLYAYNLKFTTADNDSKDFKGLNLLDVIDAATGHTTLGYAVNQLPGFVLPAADIENLKILHGSCRNNDTLFEDTLAFADNIIKSNLADPSKRPQQMFLSGDQIYADSVVGVLLQQLIETGNELMDKKETLPTTWAGPANKTRWPADSTHFPAFIRRRLIDSESRFTSSDTANHLISFGEFAAMYLAVWSDTSWPADIDAMKDFQESFNTITAVPENFGAIFRKNLYDERSGATPIVEDATMQKSLGFLFGIADKEILKALLSNIGTEPQKAQAKATLKTFIDGISDPEEKQKVSDFIDYLKNWLGPFYPKKDKDNKDIPGTGKEKLKIFKQTLPKVRRALANISTFMMFDDHEITDDWNLNPAWRDRVFTSPLGKAIIRNGMMSYALFQDWGNRADKYNRTGYFFELDKALATELDAGQLSETLKTAFTEKGITLDSEKVTIRLLHTDEWLLQNSENKDEFIIRKYKKNATEDAEVLKVLGNPHAHLLKKISELFNEPEANITAAEDHIDFLLGLDFQHRVTGAAGGRQQAPENRSPLIKWHFTYEGSTHKVLVIDNRTRRSFVNAFGAPGNLSFDGMKDLIPENPTIKENDVLFVVAPLPVLGPPVLDELIAPLAYKTFDLIDYFKEGESTKSGMQGTNPDAIEAWSFDPESQEELLKRLAPYKRIILLSGDVHYSASQRLCYWTKGNEKAVACFAQLTSSGIRNVMPSYIQKASQHFVNAQKILRQNIRAERAGWLKHDINPDPLIFPDKTKVSFLNDKLNKSPVVIPLNGWPKGSEFGREPDWSWRIENMVDYRKENERPSSTRVDELEETDDTMKNLQQIARRHIAQAKKINYTRQILFKANIGLVAFEKKQDEPIHVLHNLYAAPVDGKAGTIQEPDVYALHKIPLEASETEKAPALPK